MAFQGKQPFFRLLQASAKSASISEAAPAENFILDERVPAAREDDFLSFLSFGMKAAPTLLEWFGHQKAYATARVARPRVSATFTSENQANHFAPEAAMHVVRIETVTGLNGRARSAGLSDDEVRGLIEELVDAKRSGRPLDTTAEDSLKFWIGKVNEVSDRRPAFVAPLAEVEPLLERPDWANRLRDAFGLGHIRGSVARPVAVVLMQYSLERVRVEHLRHPAWAASPTVLDDVPSVAPSSCFFPAPKKASGNGYGFTVDLDMTGTYQSEFLHAHLPYELDDIRDIGIVTSRVPEAVILRARERHRGLMLDNLVFRADLS